MQSEMCWLETLALEVNSRVVINKVKVVIKDLHLVAFRVVEEVVETLEEGLKAVVATTMGDLAWEEDPIALVECKEAAGMRGTLGATEGILGATEGVIGKGVAEIECKSGWTFLKIDLLTNILLKLSMKSLLRYKILIMSLTVCSNMVMNSPSSLSHRSHGVQRNTKFARFPVVMPSKERTSLKMRS